MVLGILLEKVSKLQSYLYKTKMDNGLVWQRHIDHISKCQIKTTP